MIVKRNKMFSDNKDKAIGAGTIGVGGTLLAKTRKGHLTGKVTRYHDTENKNVENILREGIKSKHAMDPDNLTNTILNANSRNPGADKLKDLVYTSKNKFGAFKVGIRRAQLRGQIGNNGIFEEIHPHEDVYKEILRGKSPYHKTLKLEFDYDKIKHSPKIENPELYGIKTAEDMQKLYPGINKRSAKIQLKSLGRDTHIFKGDISPSNIVGGKGYHKRTIGQVASYIKKNPKRFGKEAAKGLAGAALIGYGVHRLLRKNKEDDNKKK